MANLSNINNKFIVTDGGNLLVNATANLATYGGITINNFSDPSIAMKTTSTSGWLWTQYITSSGTNNFSMGVNQTIPYWCVKAGAGMDSPHLVVNSSGNVGIRTTSPAASLAVQANFTANGSYTTSGWAKYIFLDAENTGGGGIIWTKQSSTYNRAIINNQGKFEIGRSTANDNSGAWLSDLAIDATGNVGIGTATPNYKLEVNGGTALVGGGFYASSDQSLVTTSTYTFRDAVYINNPNSTSAAVSSNSVMSIGASSGNSVNTSLITTGAVGIGTTSPAYKLSVANASTRIISATYIDGANGIMSHGGAPNYGLESFEIRGDYISFWTDYDASHYQGVERMRIDSSGNLIFNGSANILSNTSDGADNAQIVISGGGSTVSADTRGASIHLAGNENGNGGLLQLRAGDGSVGGIRMYEGGSERIRIYGGNVGIGTTTVQNKFVVRDTGSGFNSTIQTSTVSIISKEMTDNAYHSILQLVAVRQSLTTGNASNGYLGFSTVDDSNNQGQLDAGRIAIVNEAGSSRNSPTALSFWTNPGGTQTTAAVEKMRITSGGYLFASNTGTYYGATSSFHQLVQTTGNEWSTVITNDTATPNGLYVRYNNSSPNGANHRFLYCADSSSVRLYVNSNGGIGNFSSNNVNISDERVKNNIENSGDYLNKICSIPVRLFNYKDEEEGTDKNLGVIAQEVEAVAPELVSNDGFGKTPEDGIPLKSVYSTDMMYALMKSIQELKADNDTLKARIETLENK